MRPFARATAILYLLALLFSRFPFLRAQQQPAPPSAATCSQTDTCKAVENANAAANSATSAVTNAQQAASTAQNAASHASDSAKAATDAADAAAKAAANASSAADAAAKTIKAAASTASLRTLPKRATAKKRPLDDYVPCLFDDGEVRDMRTLEAPPVPPPETPPVVKKGELLNAAGAEAVATTLPQVLTQAATPPPEPGKKSGKNPPQQVPDQDTLNFAQDHLTPDSFIGTLPEDITKKVQALAQQYNFSKILDPKTNQLKPDVASPIEKSITKLETAAAGPATTFDRPDDVSCSFSILQWKETSDTFGSRVANQYVGIEVNVRNLNQQNEFLIHDIQIAVDTGLDRAQFGRFQAARDKLVVRDVAQRGQSEDARNRIINILQAIGAIAGGASTAVTQGLGSAVEATDMSAAVAIFQGPFMTGVINIFPDHTLEHLNHINDLAFSASSTSKTVVPIQGSVPLTTFLSEKPLEQLPFARCGTNVPKWLRDKSSDPSKPGSSQYQFCKPDPYDEYDRPEPQSGDLWPAYYMHPFPFKKWRGAALDVLEHRIFVVIAGVHIKEVQKQPTLSSIACDPGKDTTIDLSKISGPNATCTLKGSDLDLISQVSLQNATDTNDKTQVQGTSSVSGGDTTQAQVVFLKSDLLKLKGSTYKLYYSLKGGEPQPTPLSVTVKQVVALSTSSIDFGSVAQGASSKPQTITLTNNGTTDLAIASIGKTGTNANDYALLPANTCGASLAAGKNCTISVTFTPTGTGERSASVSVADNGPQSPHTVELKGTGTAAPAAADH